MTSSFPDAAEPAAGTAWHAGEDLLTRYAAGTAETVVVWSVSLRPTNVAASLFDDASPVLMSVASVVLLASIDVAPLETAPIT